LLDKSFVWLQVVSKNIQILKLKDLKLKEQFRRTDNDSIKQFNIDVIMKEVENSGISVEKLKFDIREYEKIPGAKVSKKGK